ncbi:MAG: exodeoxyribonuclease VII small subunit [Gammaproteobacteria bacterium]|nr:exodeoxyribonuclease VII small subunit [Gammaproteobacteria bacterium]MYD81123.1 exodeoxyribonuclease VII small subunit [Gammaproteobacteria bacterium]
MASDGEAKKQGGRESRDTAVDFEKSLNQLESLVEEMESGDLTLEESLVAFERGVALARTCKEALRQAEERIAQLTEDNALDS